MARPDGVRLAVKDAIDVAGVPTTAGSRAVADDGRAGGGRRRLPRRGPGRRRPHRRQDQPARAVLRRHRREPVVRHAGRTRSTRRGCPAARRAVRRWRWPPARPTSPRHRHRRLDPQPGGVLRRGRAEDDLGPHPGRRHVAAGAVARHGRSAGRTVADVVEGMALLEPGLHRDGRRAGAVGGTRSGCPAPNPVIDDAVDRALAAAGCQVVDVELPGWAAAHEAGVHGAVRRGAARRTATSAGAPRPLGDDVVAAVRPRPRPSTPASWARPGPGASPGAPSWPRSSARSGCSPSRRCSSFPARIGEHAVAPNPRRSPSTWPASRPRRPGPDRRPACRPASSSRARPSRGRLVAAGGGRSRPPLVDASGLSSDEAACDGRRCGRMRELEHVLGLRRHQGDAMQEVGSGKSRRDGRSSSAARWSRSSSRTRATRSPTTAGTSGTTSTPAA